MIELLTNDAWIEVGGVVVIYLLLFFTLASIVVLPLFTGLAIHYTFRAIWRKFTEGKL